MTDSDSSGDFNNNSVTSIENTNNNKIDKDKKETKPEINQMSEMINNNKEEDDFQIENNEIQNDPNKKSENDSTIEIKNINNNNNSNNNNEKINENKERKIITNLNTNNNSIPSFNFNKRKDVIIIEIDEEKSKLKKYTVYQLIEIKNNSNSYLNNYDSKIQDTEKKILCYRRYSEFDKFYNTLKFRYPHCIFPRLSEKRYLDNENQIFLENRRKELQYFINKLYFHEEISKSEEFKRFLNSGFDEKYYTNLPKKYSYPECEKVNNEKGYISMGMNKIKGLFSTAKEHKQSEDEKNILKREEEFKNKGIKYNELLKEIKNLYDSVEETKREYKTISNNILFLKDDNSKENINEEDDCKSNFNELIDLNKNLSEDIDNNTKVYLVDIIDQLKYCILEVEGINRAIERFNNFIKEYEKVKNTKSSNKYVSIEQSKIEDDKAEFERFILQDLKKYDKEYEHIYEQIIDKLIFYIRKINEDNMEAFNKTNLV